MAGTGRAPREETNGHRTNELTKVDAVVDAPVVPPWPLGDDLALKAKQQAMLEKLADINAEIEDELAGKADGRKLGGLRRKQSAAKEKLTLVDLELEFATSLEVEIWHELWALPQAAQWRAQGWYRDIAQYARHKAKGEGGSMDDAKEARMLSDRIGLTPKSAGQIGLTFKAPAAPAPQAEQKATGTDGKVSSLDRRRRLKEG